ncbi:unnamed protein product [Meloidogyne enterolobii]|uniref:Uncharacterized protein n=1 Tax=Meloidogyne enterolobii TaxID=390850 RepID=A0ACB0ZAL0_MELEN
MLLHLSSKEYSPICYVIWDDLKELGISALGDQGIGLCGRKPDRRIVDGKIAREWD